MTRIVAARLHSGFEAAFYAFGIAAVLWLPLWIPLPMSAQRDGSAQQVNQSNAIREWLALVQTREVQAICVAQFCGSWGLYGLLNWLPTFFKEAQGVSLEDLPAFTFLPYVLQGVVGAASGLAADAAIRDGWSVLTVRRYAQAIGMVGPAACLLFAASPAAEGNAVVAGTAVDVGLGLSALTLAGVSVSHLDVAPRHAGLVFATGNLAATVAGVLAVPTSGADVVVREHVRVAQ